MTDTGELSDLVRIDRTRWVGAQRRIAHWRRFRHHDALNSRCYDGPPHRPRRSGPVPVWLRRADVVMKTPEFSFHDRRGAPNPRANNCRGPGLASVCGRARATHGMKGMLLNRPPTSGYESRCSSAAALKATNSSAKHRPLWLQRLRSWAGNVTPGCAERTLHTMGIHAQQTLPICEQPQQPITSAR